MKNKKYIFFISILLLILWNTTLFAGEFLNTFLHVNLSASYGFVEGDIFNHEHDSYSIKDYKGNNIRPNHYSYSFGMFLDLAPFPSLVLGDEAHAFKIGLRAAYRFTTIIQSIDIKVTRTDEDSYRENYIVYESPMIGIVIRYAPIIKPSSIHGDFLADGGLTIFALYGKVRDGKLYSYPIMKTKETDPEQTSNDTETKVTGYRMDLGIGGEISICSINLGMNLMYSVIDLTMDNQLYANINKKTRYYEASFELYLSLPFEWSRTRRQF